MLNLSLWSQAPALEGGSRLGSVIYEQEIGTLLSLSCILDDALVLNQLGLLTYQLMGELRLNMLQQLLMSVSRVHSLTRVARPVDARNGTVDGALSVDVLKQVRKARHGNGRLQLWHLGWPFVEQTEASLDTFSPDIRLSLGTKWFLRREHLTWSLLSHIHI